ncbi:hypothetical protein [Salinimonas chungwhensis]|uniref:hypothetical protein n=1 Tax=Salinimonas chungwhensis TaxID=265425 RepID=UPI000363A48D|nr:hypothetical protein [Salinimonas chungwhensis]
MLETFKKINFTPVAGHKYPIAVTLPCGKTLQGMALCAEDVVCNGVYDFSPGFISLEISALNHLDEIGDMLDHDFVEESILYGMNDGACMQVRTNYGLEWEVSDQGIPVPTK